MSAGPPKSFEHMAVRVKHYILVLGGTWKKREKIPLRKIWMYNICTQQWQKYVITRKKAPPATLAACAVAIEEDVYMFGGYDLQKDTTTNALWTLNRNTQGCFVWDEIVTSNNKKTPSPRSHHSGWEYSGKLWTFGGGGLALQPYLNDYGDFIWNSSLERPIANNQLLCFSPYSEEWGKPGMFWIHSLTSFSTCYNKYIL